MGPSGSGKSTLALALAGLVPHEFAGEWAGWLTVDGVDVARGPRADVAARVGIVFQDPESQLVMERVEDDVAFGLENRALPASTIRRGVTEALSAVGLAGFDRRRSNLLSGGEQQRLALAGVLAAEPRILVLDEPTANLDPDGTAAFFERLTNLRDARSTTIVLVEHRVDLAWPLADRVLALAKDGRPIDHGSPAEVLERSGERMKAEGIWLPEEFAPAAATVDIRGPGGGSDVATATEVGFAYVPARPAVDGVSAAILERERVALLGPNGSGKSTFGRLLVGLIRPVRGRVRLLGDDPARLPARELARRAGYVFQDPERQFLAARVADEVALGLDADELRRVEPLMASLGLPLEAFGDRSPYTLSGGEQRRVSLACMLVRSPRLLVLDEPTFGQDRIGYESLLAILHDRVDDGSAVLAATHDPRFVRDFATRVIRMRNGRVEDAEPPRGAAA